MPIYEFACPKCRKIFNFLSKKLQPERVPVCPKCGNCKMTRQLSAFATPRGAQEPSAAGEAGPMPEMDDPRLMRAMSELERDMGHMDENNPRHLARLMRKMKDLMPAGTTPKELETAIKRLEAGEDPEKVEADMGNILDEAMGGPSGAGGYTRDDGLYDY